MSLRSNTLTVGLLLAPLLATGCGDEADVSGDLAQLREGSSSEEEYDDEASGDEYDDEYGDSQEDEAEEYGDKDEDCDGCVKPPRYWEENNGYESSHKDREEWPLSEKSKLCGLTYLEILETPVQTNWWYELAHQTIAAELNFADGATMPFEVWFALDEAFWTLEDHCGDALYYGPDDGYLVQTSGYDEYDPYQDELEAYAKYYEAVLFAFNWGLVGPEKCDVSDHYFDCDRYDFDDEDSKDGKIEVCLVLPDFDGYDKYDHNFEADEGVTLWADVKVVDDLLYFGSFLGSCPGEKYDDEYDHE